MNVFETSRAGTKTEKPATAPVLRRGSNRYLPGSFIFLYGAVIGSLILASVVSIRAVQAHLGAVRACLIIALAVIRGVDTSVRKNPCARIPDGKTPARCNGQEAERGGSSRILEYERRDQSSRSMPRIWLLLGLFVVLLWCWLALKWLGRI